jgi:hypothetical protein
MHHDLGPGQEIDLTSSSGTGDELLYSYEFMARWIGRPLIHARGAASAGERAGSGAAQHAASLGQLTNQFSYVDANPLISTDPMGLAKLTDAQMNDLYCKLGCIAFVGLMLKRCLDDSNAKLNKCLAIATKMNTKELRDEQTRLCSQIFDLDATDCSANYLAMALCCTLPFCNPLTANKP